MPTAAAGPEIERLIGLLARLPGLGPRSARRAALFLIKKREQIMAPLAAAMTVPALAVAFWRNAFGTAAIAPTLKPAELGRWRLMVASGLALAVHFGTWIPSLRLTSVASATALCSLASPSRAR